MDQFQKWTDFNMSRFQKLTDFKMDQFQNGPISKMKLKSNYQSHFIQVLAESKITDFTYAIINSKLTFFQNQGQYVIIFTRVNFQMST